MFILNLKNLKRKIKEYLESTNIFSINRWIFFSILWFTFFGVFSFYDWVNGVFNIKINKNIYALEVGFAFYSGLTVLWGNYFYMIVKPFINRYLDVMEYMSHLYVKFRKRNYRIIYYLSIFFIYFFVDFFKKYTFRPVDVNSVFTPIFGLGLYYFFYSIIKICSNFVVVKEVVNILERDKNEIRRFKWNVFISEFSPVALMLIILLIEIIFKVLIFIRLFIIVIIIAQIILYFVLIKEMKRLGGILINEERYLNLLDRLKELKYSLEDILK